MVAIDRREMEVYDGSVHHITSLKLTCFMGEGKRGRRYVTLLGVVGGGMDDVSIFSFLYVVFSETCRSKLGVVEEYSYLFDLDVAESCLKQLECASHSLHTYCCVHVKKRDMWKSWRDCRGYKRGLSGSFDR